MLLLSNNTDTLSPSEDEYKHINLRTHLLVRKLKSMTFKHTLTLTSEEVEEYDIQTYAHIY